MGAIDKKLRRNTSYIKLSEYLNEQGYRFEPVRGSKHPYLLVDVGVGEPIKFFFPMTASDRRSASNGVASIKRVIRERLEGRGHGPAVRH
ncbi:hypothetical protein [Rhodopseudomonas palustris]|uniref:hypothetical protein n=1 Tax=Rhodopseudomonas palustris TaxID=1076 RepID=UPI000641D458|nr:hypothetical protein [Rhodopseudomonas palustris]